MRPLRVRETEVSWRLGTSTQPKGVDLFVPFDRTAGVIGPQGSGKTLDVLIPALLDAPGAGMMTLTKPEDMLLSLTERRRHGRPTVVLDPFGLAEGIGGELVWDPIEGCVSAWVAERRAKAFAAGTVKGSMQSGAGDDAARFYAEETAKVLKCFFHAAALTGRNLNHVLEWVSNPTATTEPEEILSQHPKAEQHWKGLLQKALRGDDRTAGNTITTLQQAMSLFFQEETRRRCVPSKERPATDIANILRSGGTIYLLGREDPYASASPMMTAVAEQVLDTGLQLAYASPFGRLTPPLLTVLDEMPSTAPIPTLRTRMANERALGLSFIWAAQVRAQLDAIFGEMDARALIGLTNELIIFGGSKDLEFNREMSDLIDTVRIARHTRNTVGIGGTTHGDDIAVISPGEIRELNEGTAMVLAENSKLILAKLDRCIEDNRPWWKRALRLGLARGPRLLADQAKLRSQLQTKQSLVKTPEAEADAAVALADDLGLTPPPIAS